MEWRLGHGRRVAVVAIATTAACIGIAFPASAHNGEHQAVLASEQQAGPFLVTAWTSEGMSTGEIPIAVEIKGGEAVSGLEVVAHIAGANQSLISVALQAAPSLGPAVWEGVLLATDGTQQELVIEVTDQNGHYQTAPIPMTVVVAGIGWAILIAVLAVQALGYLGWLVLRAPRVWRHQVVRVH